MLKFVSHSKQYNIISLMFNCSSSVGTTWSCFLTVNSYAVELVPIQVLVLSLLISLAVHNKGGWGLFQISKGARCQLGSRLNLIPNTLWRLVKIEISTFRRISVNKLMQKNKNQPLYGLDNIKRYWKWWRQFFCVKRVINIEGIYQF